MIKLSAEERKYLWSKIEYKKKKISIEKENFIYRFLNGNDDDLSYDNFKIILNSLEYRFKNSLNNLEKGSEMLKSIQSKIIS